MKMIDTNYSILKSVVILAIIGILAGCEPGPYGNNDWRYPQNSYPSYPAGGYYPAPGNYGGGYYPPPPPPPPPPRYDNRYDYRYDDRRYEDRDRHHHHDDPPPPPPPPPQASPPPSQPSTIRPSCPSGTTFNGKHCIIDDKSKIRPGGKGTVNPCPKGMRLSGDRCIDS